MKRACFLVQYKLLGIFNSKGKFILLVSFLVIGFYSCTTDRSVDSADFEKDTDGDGINDNEEVLNGTNKNNPCDPLQNSDYVSYDPLNILWAVADCDNDGINNGDEYSMESNPYSNESVDTDGDGIVDYQEIENGTDKDDPCDPFQNSGYLAYDEMNPIWSAADCDGDGMNNDDELTNNTDPYFDEIGGIDTDGDGIKDGREILEGTDLDNPCDPVQVPGYKGYDPSNTVWSMADCDGDGINNGDEIVIETDPYLDNTIYAVPEFLPTLSELRLFEGDISDLKFNKTVHEYSLRTQIFADYSHQLRSIALPKGGQMQYTGEGLLSFPDNTILTMTFYYLNDERDPALGKKIIETRVMIKVGGVWNIGNYLWNVEQTQAFLNEGMHAVQIDWIDNLGNDRAVNYRVPSKVLCFQCHNNNSTTIPIGPKSRALNFVHNGNNQIQYFVDNGLLTGAPNISQIAVLPDWSDKTQLLEGRARAYLDVNCAHCHQPGGNYNVNYGGVFDFSFQTSFEDSKINDVKVAIQDRMSTQISGYFMPLIGTTVIHAEGVELINEYIDSLE